MTVLLQVLSDVYGVPLKPLHPDTQPQDECSQQPEEGQLPQARSPALLPQPYAVRTAVPAQPGQAQPLPEPSSELARPVRQDTATQTTDDRGSQTGEQASVAEQGDDILSSTARTLPPPANAAPRLIADRTSSVVPPPQGAPVEQHLDRYYLAAAGRELDILTQLMGGQGTSSAPVPAQLHLPALAEVPRPSKPPARHRERRAGLRTESLPRTNAAPSQKRPPAQQLRPSTPADTSSAEPRPLQLAQSLEHAAVPVRAPSVQEQTWASSEAPKTAAGAQQQFSWAQGAWMEQIAAVAAAAASAATAAVHAQQTHEAERLPPPLGFHQSTLPEAPSKPELSLQLGEIPGSSVALTGDGLAVPASASAEGDKKPGQGPPVALQPSNSSQPASVQRHFVERSVQTEEETIGSALMTAPVQEHAPQSSPLQSERPITGRLMHSSEEAPRQLIAPETSMKAHLEQATRSFDSAKAHPFGPLTQPLPFQVRAHHHSSPFRNE